METSAATYTAGGMGWNVIKPDGSKLRSYNYSANQFLDTWTLPEDGTYRVVIDPGGTATGSVKFRAWEVPADVQSVVTAGGPALTVATTVAGQNGEVTFAGTAGQTINVITSNPSYTAGGMGWNVTNPDGTKLRSYNYSAGSSSGLWVLPADGTYRITVDPGGLATGSVDVRVSPS